MGKIDKLHKEGTVMERLVEWLFRRGKTVVRWGAGN